MFAGAVALWAGGSLFLFLLGVPDLLLLLIPVTALGIVATWPSIALRGSFLISAVGLVGGVVITEVAIRLVVFGPDAIIRFTEYGPRTILDSRHFELIDDPELVFRMRPGFRGRYMGRDLIVNSAGLRGPELDVSAAGVLRVASFGTSITWGAGVDHESAYPAEVARMLRARGIPAEGINAGVPAYSTSQIFTLAERFYRNYAPDVIVVEVHPSALSAPVEFDPRVRQLVTTRAQDPSFVERYSFAAAGLYPATGLRARLSGILPAARAHVVSGDASSAQYIASRIRQLVDLTSTSGTKVIVLFVPPMTSFGLESDGVERAKVAAAARASGALVVDGYPLFSRNEFPDRFIVFPGDLHPNGRAHARLASALATTIERHVRPSGPGK